MHTPTLPLPRAGYRREFRPEGRCVLKIEATYPPFSDGNYPRRVERYQQALIRSWLRRWEGSLLARATAAAPEEPWLVQLQVKELFRDEGRLSLLTQVTEHTDAPRPRQVRQCDSWHLPSGYPLTLREALPPQRWWKGAVFAAVRQQIGSQLARGEALYYEDWPALVSRQFDPERWYLTPQGPAVFYPPEILAPSLEGWPTFLLSAAASQDPTGGEVIAG